MKKHIKSTYDEHIEAMTDAEKKEFEKELKKLALSEMIYAAIEKDELSVQRMAKIAGVSPSFVSRLKSAEKNLDLGSLFKILESLGFSLLLERDGDTIALDISQLLKTDPI
jgi:transcriptional regulator with XRE-family HTH domain